MELLILAFVVIAIYFLKFKKPKRKAYKRKEPEWESNRSKYSNNSETTEEENERILKGLSSGKGQPKNNPTSKHYYINKRLFTPPELKFMKALQEAVPEYHIMGKVRVADVINVKKTKDNSEYYSAFGKIKSKHFDFVLCDPESFEPKLAIELDDSSHSRKSRIERDNFLNQVCSENGFYLIRQETRISYKVEDIRAKIMLTN